MDINFDQLRIKMKSIRLSRRSLPRPEKLSEIGFFRQHDFHPQKGPILRMEIMLPK